MDSLKQWLISLAFSALGGTLITVVSPKGANDKTLKTVVGIFIISTVFLPVSELNVHQFSLSAFADSVEYESDGNDELAFEMLEEELLQRITDIANECGCEIRNIEIDAEYDEGKCIIIHKIILNFTNGNEENILKTATETERILGVPIEMG